MARDSERCVRSIRFFPSRVTIARGSPDPHNRRAARIAATAMDIRKIAIVATLTIAWAVPALAAAPAPEMGRYKGHVATLASAEFGGRRGAGAVKAAAYVERELKQLGLQPVFGTSYVQEIPNSNTGGVLGRNIGAKIVGTDPKLRDEWILVGAHFDHLGRAGTTYFPGADDNASGVGMMLEVARCLAQSDVKPRRSILFLGFDLEEDGLWGSRYFVEHSPIALDRVKLFVTADMIGRALGGVCKDFVFAFGAETSPGMKVIIDQASQGQPVNLGLIGNDLLMVDRSDYGPFRRLSIPYLFFSTGENPHYHRPSDRSDTLDYDKALAVTRIIHGIIRRAADSDHLPPWNGKTEPSLDEAIAVRDVMKVLLANREQLEIGPAVTLVLRSTLAKLEGIVIRGMVTPAERSQLVRAARVLMMTVL
ncbi:MAG: putative aminopeptidase [Planctomycetota bacterium]|nr:putative aminopeptidase [Planctomycetota bacterium]